MFDEIPHSNLQDFLGIFPSLDQMLVAPQCTSSLMMLETHARVRVISGARSNLPRSRRKLPKNLRHPRRAKAPPDAGINRFPLTNENYSDENQLVFLDAKEEESAKTDNDDSVWSQEELEAISALFERKTPLRPTKPLKERPLPLPLPYKTRNMQMPTPKHHVRLASKRVLAFRSATGDKVRKNPEALVTIAREIGELPTDVNISKVLNKWAPFLRKGSLSLTIRELGHMGLPERALQTLCWAQDHRPELFPDDRILASTVEVLARSGKLKIEVEMEEYLNAASQSVVEAMAKGFIRAGHLRRARKLLLVVRDNKMKLNASIHAKLILAAGKTPDGYKFASALIDELGEREDFDLETQDCTAIMKVCIKIGRFEAVESLFDWFKASGRSPNIVMYTTMLHGRYCSKQFREGMSLVWEMEGMNCLLDLPAYRVVIKLCVALNDLARAVRYYSKLKEAGFTPTYDIYRNMIEAFAASGALAKCKQICKEVDMAGMKLDREIVFLLSEMERVGPSSS